MTKNASDIKPLLKKYGKRRHPLDYENKYQLVVAVILAAQASDNQVNRIAPEFFRAFASFQNLKDHEPEELYPYLKSIRGFRKKSEWLTGIAAAIGNDSAIPSTMAELTKLPGIGRKSANVIIRESGGTAEGIVVDLHVVRVAPRIGIVSTDKPDKIEKELMEAIPHEQWNDAGMALSFHGREICRPKPVCDECIINSVCDYYINVISKNK